MSSATYKVPASAGTVQSVKSSVLAAGVSLFFMFLVNFSFQFLITFVLDRDQKEKNKIKGKLLEVCRVIYLFVIATMFSVYPPFYYGPHCALLSWITLIIIVFLHIFCIIEKQCKGRSLWSVFYFLYHLSITIWIFLAMVVGYAWSNNQNAASDELYFDVQLLYNHMNCTVSRISKLIHSNVQAFSGFAGPYNPYLYKDYLAPRNYPTNKEIYNLIKNQDQIVTAPVRNMRHVNPVRQSGPLPAYYGSFTMQDIRKIFDQTTIGKDVYYTNVDADQIMRRVPGITRKQVQQILKMNLSPYQQVCYAYFVYNMGYDVFYKPNGVYVARQVVTNSKGQKVQVYTNAMCWEDLANLNVNFAPVLETIDYHWQIFLWADPPIKVTGDMDLGVPNTWFEYQIEFSTQATIAQDQMNIPEDARPFDTGRNPNCRSELWKSQQKLAQQLQMRNPGWTLPQL